VPLFRADPVSKLTMSESSDKRKLRGVRISEPLVQPFAPAVRVLEWKGVRGETHLRAVRHDATSEHVAEMVRRHVVGTQYIFVDAAAPVREP
jgi:hypothetical protein